MDDLAVERGAGGSGRERVKDEFEPEQIESTKVSRARDGIGHLAHGAKVGGFRIARGLASGHGRAIGSEEVERRFGSGGSAPSAALTRFDVPSSFRGSASHRASNSTPRRSASTCWVIDTIVVSRAAARLLWADTPSKPSTDTNATAARQRSMARVSRSLRATSWSCCRKSKACMQVAIAS